MNFKSYTVHEIDELSRTGIYAIVNKVNGKFYIGSAGRIEQRPSQSGFYDRWRGHIYCLNRGDHGNQHLQNAWNKYGESAFRFQILEFVESDRCIEVEQTYLDLFPEGDRDIVYNICFTAGSMLGFKHSDETRLKMSGPYKLISPEGVVYEGNNLTEFCRDNNLSPSHFPQIAKGNRLHYKGWTCSLEAHQLYIKFYPDRGIRKREKDWGVRWIQNDIRKSKYFKVKEEAIKLRDKLEKEGYEFAFKIPNWREKLNAKENS